MTSTSHRSLTSNRGPQSSRDLSVYTVQELDQLRKSNASVRHTKLEKFRLFFWNRNQRTVCYRTGTSWLFIVTFYPLFVAFILCLFMLNLMIVIYIIDWQYPDRPMVEKLSLTKKPKYIVR